MTPTWMSVCRSATDASLPCHPKIAHLPCHPKIAPFTPSSQNRPSDIWEPLKATINLSVNREVTAPGYSRNDPSAITVVFHFEIKKENT